MENFLVQARGRCRSRPDPPAGASDEWPDSGGGALQLGQQAAGARACAPSGKKTSSKAIQLGGVGALIELNGQAKQGTAAAS